MQRFTEDCLTLLAAHHEWPSVSLYMPTRSWHTLQGQNEDRTRFRNLARSAAESLVDRGMRRPDAADVLDSLRKQSENELFWRQAQRGLAAFLSRAETRVFALPDPPPEKVVVLDRYYLKPLLSYLGQRGRFYILAASENAVALLEGDRYQLNKLDVPGLPHDLEEAVDLDAPRDAVSVLTTSRAATGQRTAVFHGQGGSGAHRKTNLETYFRKVDRAIVPVLAGASTPMIFAGVSYLYPLYRSINRYAYLLGECIPGNPDLYSHDELRRRAWSLVEAFYARSREMAAARFMKLHGTGRASNNVQELVWASHDGLIDSLFVATDADEWGIIDTARRSIEPVEANYPGAQELLNLIALQTFRQHGTVYAVNRSQVPGGETVAAVYRYSPMAPY